MKWARERGQGRMRPRRWQRVIEICGRGVLIGGGAREGGAGKMSAGTGGISVFFFLRAEPLLCVLSRKILWIFFSDLPGNFALKNGGDFWWIFSGLRFPRNEARKLLEKFGENSERNSGQNPGRNFEKFGELSFCKFSDLTNPDEVHPLNYGGGFSKTPCFRVFYDLHLPNQRVKCHHLNLGVRVVRAVVSGSLFWGFVWAW